MAARGFSRKVVRAAACVIERIEQRLLLSALSDDGNQLGLGLLAPTAEDQQWAYQNMIVTQGVRLNDLAIARINAEYQGGASPLAATTSIQPGSGGEIIGATQAELDQNPQSASASLALEAPLVTLPDAVDNSTSSAFPPIRSQGSLGSCACFASTYYTMTYMTALARGWDVKNDPTDIHKFSPKWTYNIVNGGNDAGSTAYDAYQVMLADGSATWAQLPYDSDFRVWCSTPATWKSAINYRMNQTGSVTGLDTASGVTNLKTLLADGYVLNYATYVYSWQFGTIGNDPSTTADDAYVGKSICTWVNGTDGAHEMTVVGYNDNIWVDINGNGIVDPGEKGAFRIANSWGTGWQEGGFTWLSYDALKKVSGVSGAPSANRQPAWWSNEADWITAKTSYTPTLMAEFTVQHAKRNQIEITVGKSATSSTTPTSTFKPFALDNHGGPYGFDGKDYSANPSAAPAATFVVDMTGLNPESSIVRRYYLGLNDTTDPTVGGTVSAYQIQTPTRVIAICPTGTSPGNVPKSDADGASSIAYAYVDSSVVGKVYVDKSAHGANNGTSWADAFVSLQSALAVAVTGTKVYVAQGTYKPTASTDRTASFQITTGVGIFGGYAGYGAADPNDRDVVAYPTILSGDIGAAGDSADNSYHVVVIANVSPSPALDGFTITGGNANGAGAGQSNGGGVLGAGGSPIVSQCTFIGNSASSYGGGMYDSSGAPNVLVCTFSGNSAADGGGLYNDQSTPTVTNCTFTANSTSGDFASGGGVYNNASSPTLNGCTFSGNTASGYSACGGGMYNNGSSPTLSNCTFIANSTSGEWAGGGGMYNNNASAPSLTNCTFSGNSSGAGGGMENEASSPTLTNCAFSGNSASDYGGGGVFNDSACSPTLINCTFSGNSANGIAVSDYIASGGGMYSNIASPTLTNCTFSGNVANNSGGGIYGTGGSSPRLRMTLVAANSAASGPDLAGSLAADSDYDLFGILDPAQLTSAGAHTLSGIAASPLDPKLDAATTINGLLVYPLLPGSPAIDAGNNDLAVDAGGNPLTCDEVGNPRIAGAAVDIGAYEFQPPPPLVISGSADGDQIYVKNDAGTLKWWIVPAAAPMPDPATDTPTGTMPLNQFTTLSVQSRDGNDTIILDFSGGILSDATAGGVSIDGGSGDDYLLLKGINSALDLSAFPAAVGAEKITSLAGVEDIGFADGSVSLAGLPAGTGLVAAGTASVTLTVPMTLPSLEISGTAKISLAAGGGNTLVISPATPTSINFNLPADTSPAQPFVGLDLNDNGIIVKAGNLADRDALLATLSGLIQRSRNAFASSNVLWAGNGIRSSTAAAEAALDVLGHTGLTGVAIAPNVNFNTTTGAEAGVLHDTWKGQSGLDSNAVLLAYSYNGDANVDGNITFDDYSAANYGFLHGKIDYWWGNFDYSSVVTPVVNFDDYFLLNQAFLKKASHSPDPIPMAKAVSPFSTKAVGAAVSTKARVVAHRIAKARHHVRH